MQRGEVKTTSTQKDLMPSCEVKDCVHMEENTPVQEVQFNIKKTAFVSGTILQIRTVVDGEYNTGKAAIVTGVCKDDHTNTGEQ